MPAIGVIIGWLIGAIGTALASYVGRILIALGITYVTYSGVDVLLNNYKSDVFLLLGVGGTMQGIVAVCRIGDATNILFSAFAARMALNGLTGGAFTKMKIK